MKKLLVLSLILLVAVYSNVDAQKKKVTFKADMRIEISKGKFNPATDVVTVPGGMNNWLNEPPANSTKVLTDADNDQVYELMYELDPGTYDYKFNIGLGWDGKDEPGDNSKVTVGTEDITITRFIYNKTPYTKVATNVTFSIDMTLPINQGFNPATGKVYVAGNFTDWGNGALEMTDPDGDKKYTVTKSVTSGDVLIYKFINSAGAASAGNWESPANTPAMSDVFGGDNNRIYGVVDGTNTVERFWNNADPNVQLASGNISFTADMSVLEELGVFNPATDNLQIRGGFNGWSDSDQAKSKMNQSPLLPEEWFISIPFVNQEVNKDQTYKYYAIVTNPGIWTDTWERPLSTGGGDRSVTFKGESNQEVAKLYYDDVYPAFVIPNGSFVQIKFRVNMADAFDANKVAVPMETGDKLYWLPRQPLFKTLMNWAGEEDAVENFELTDPDGDKIYEGTLTVNGPSFNAFQYRYGYKKADGSWQREPTALGTAVSGRVRYIPQTAARTFTQPYTAPLDSWLTDADKSSQFETWPAGLPTSVRDLDLQLPTEFTLQQNYPNPFNPSTLIRFTIPQGSRVSLKVFNVLGQEVASLVNENLNAGTYEYAFNASKLGSGVYFYTLKAGDFSSTKKMLLIK